MSKHRFRWRSAPDHTGGDFDAPQTLQSAEGYDTLLHHLYRPSFDVQCPILIVTASLIQCHNTNTVSDKKAVLSQRWPRNAPYIWVPWKFSGLPDYVHGHYSQYFHRLLFRSTLWMFLQNLKSVALPVAEIIGGTQKIWAVPGYAHARLSSKF